MRQRLYKNTEYLIKYLQKTLWDAAELRSDTNVIKIPELQILMQKKYNFLHMIKKYRKKRVIVEKEQNTRSQLIKYALIENTFMQLLRGYLIDIRENVIFLYPSSDESGARNYIPYFIEYTPSKQNLAMIFNTYKKKFF